MNKQNDSYDYDDDETVPDASDLLDFELIAHSQPEKTSGGVWLWAALGMVLLGGGAAGWFYLQGGGEETVAQGGSVPLILAPQFDLKEKP
ncbi:MAG: hypothetical protein HQL36_11260, partial [Alphaproteobacteria bacterium]|nr:hypothetical protein [Alphaproteobacteria bacterium]